MSMLVSIIVALTIDRLFGWPDWLFRRISHPVIAIGHLISFCDKIFNKTNKSSANRRFGGIITVFIIGGLCFLSSLIISSLIPDGFVGIILTSLLIWPWIGARSLSEHVIKVAIALANTDTDAARSAVSMIVGRNTEKLDEHGIARASLESLSENTSDGVVAPLFWTTIFGLPGLFIYKAINTMDSRIGYRTQEYEAFGWAAAKLDDFVNFLPARITGTIYAFTAKKPVYCFNIMRRDARKEDRLADRLTRQENIQNINLISGIVNAEQAAERATKQLQIQERKDFDRNNLLLPYCWHYERNHPIY